MPAAPFAPRPEAMTAVVDMGRPTPVTIMWPDRDATPEGLDGLWWNATESEIQARVPPDHACRLVRARMGIRELAWPMDARWFRVELAVTLVLEDGALVRVLMNGRPGAFGWADISDAGFASRDENWVERVIDGTRIAVDLLDGNVVLDEAP